jgi:hypothetical protein
LGGGAGGFFSPARLIVLLTLRSPATISAAELFLIILRRVERFIVSSILFPPSISVSASSISASRVPAGGAEDY